MEKSTAVGSTPVPPYESNPQYGSPPPAGQFGQQPPQPTMHQDSYPINQAPNQGQYHQQPISPQSEIKQEYYGQPQHPGMGQPQTSQPQVVVVAQGQQLPAQQQSQYHTSTPIQSLGEGPAPVDCPSCRARALTRTQYVSGNTTL
ncbi:hypothetical protein MMC22_007186 [Lobaria immixta]|nr:hypothetical protein [Lobaria immixta]